MRASPTNLSALARVAGSYGHTNLDIILRKFTPGCPSMTRIVP